jgi:hypothetical protein
MKLTTLRLFVCASVACSSTTELSISETTQLTTSMPSVTDVTVVFQVGDPGVPTDEDLLEILVSPPAEAEPSVSTMLGTAQAVLDSLPSGVRESAIDELVRVGGNRLWCVFGGGWACGVCVGGKTYYCGGASSGYHCGVLLGCY